MSSLRDKCAIESILFVKFEFLNVHSLVQNLMYMTKNCVECYLDTGRQKNGKYGPWIKRRMSYNVNQTELLGEV